ncbi:hypothetical protein HDU76_008279 [Blyttiomyces sp. JEL0837]|nr:hypothetical protein HDU76_008279 [Blyttiomyces sp. JEL0837]
MDTKKPRLLLMGLRRCGKSSIQNVVFHKMSPNETLFLESTTKVGKDDVINFIDFEVWDFPGHIDFYDPAFDAVSIFGDCGAIVFVVDAQDDYHEALKRLYLTVTRAYSIETQRDIHQRMMDDLLDGGFDNVHLSFYLTSIYDHSIFEAFSKVIQKLIPQLPTLENLLNILCSNSGIEKAFLFDMLSKIYIATDSSPVDIQSYELCSDMIDVALDISAIYAQPVSLAQLKSVNGSQEPKKEEAHAAIRLNNGLVLYLREVNSDLSLICLIRDDNFEKKGLIDYNFSVFRTAVNEVFEIRKKTLRSLPGSR